MTEQSKSYIDRDGDKVWFLPSKGTDHWHRLDGPALERTDGSTEWWVDDRRHRLDGPAIEYLNGKIEWWVNDILLNKRKIEAWLKENNVDLKTPEGQMAFKLMWT